MKWDSVEDIIKHFNLKVDETDVSNVRSALIQLLAKSHPEISGGDFETEEQKEKYIDIQRAIKDLNILGSEQNALVSVNQMTDIIKAVFHAIAPGKENQQPNIELYVKNELHKKIISFYKPLKISSGTITGVCTALIIFSKTLSENTILAPFFEFIYSHSILLYVLFISATWFVFMWFKEQKDEQRKEWLFSEDGKLIILAEVVGSFGKKVEDKVIFSFRSFVRTIQGKRKKRTKSIIKIYLSNIYQVLYGASIISTNIAEQIAHHHLSNFEKQNIIKKHNTKSIEYFYEIDSNLIHQLPDRSYYKYFY
ncbi:MAG: hypothetical protein KKC46_09585 [Proteobacteria bacterium]|nr:hypothetical protein [Pseudomonadota bacterium]